MKFTLVMMLGAVAVLFGNFKGVDLQILYFPPTDDFLMFDIDTNPMIGNVSQNRAHYYSDQVKFQAIMQKAKKISKSKGPFRTREDGKDLEYRRSLIQKLRLKTNSLALRKVMDYFEDTSDEKILDNLDVLKHIVHEYNAAKDFISIGGIELLKELIQMDDVKVATAALSVLSASMQGNPDVQQMAFENNVLDILVDNLASDHYLPNILFALSSHLRQMPDSQMRFFEMDGVALLVDLFKNHSNEIQFRMHTIQILGDIAYEMFEAIEIEITSSTYQRIVWIKTFERGIESAYACQEIAVMLKCNEYSSICDFNRKPPKYFIHVKIIDAMNDLRFVCGHIFRLQSVRKSVEKLLNIYYPFIKLPWYSLIDDEFRYTMYHDILVFYENVYHRKYVRSLT